jgi:hypothetical protein
MAASKDRHVPADHDKVMAATQLGWLMAEVRGRYSEPFSGGVTRTDYVLPLRYERSPPERAIETVLVLIAVAQALGVDIGFTIPRGARKGETASATSKLDGLTRKIHAKIRSERKAGMTESTRAKDQDVANPPTDGDLRDKEPGAGAKTSHARDWRDLAEFLFEWDGKIQDLLATQSAATATGYQLGKGFSEIRWALKPTVDSAKDFRSWNYLLGERRVAELTNALRRQLPYYDDLTVHALAASLWMWSQVAADPTLRVVPSDDKNALAPHDDPLEHLSAQAAIWHGLLSGELTAETLLTPEDVIKNIGRDWAVLRKFALPAGIALAGVVALAAGTAAFFSSNPAGWKVGAAVIAAFGLFGITTASLLAKVRDSAQGILEQMRQALYADLVAAAATSVPAAAEGRIKRLDRGRNLNDSGRPGLKAMTRSLESIAARPQDMKGTPPTTSAGTPAATQAAAPAEAPAATPEPTATVTPAKAPASRSASGGRGALLGAPPSRTRQDRPAPIRPPSKGAGR